MNTSTKTVLLFQSSRFQAEIWRSILWEHNIIVIWEENYTNKQNAASYFKTLNLTPNLLIIDLKIDNAYELCRCFNQYYPLAKIILTTDSQDGYSSAIRRWALSQGVDELLINFQKANLFSSAIKNINSALKLLDLPAVNQETLIKILDSLGQKNLAIPQEPTYYQPSRISITHPEEVNAKTISPMVRLSFFLVILLLGAIVLDGSTLVSIAPVEGLQRKMSVNENKLTSRIDHQKLETLQEIAQVPQGIFNYGGSTTWAPIRKVVTPKINQEYPEFNLRYLPAIDTTPGSGTGILMLLEGDLDFSHSSRSIKPKEHIIAHQQGFTLREYHIGIDAIAVAVHPSLEISGLTISQLKKIYLGQITNWKELNGPDLAIVPFSRRVKDGGTPNFFQHHILHDKPFGQNLQYVYSTTDGLKRLQNTPGGIYYASATGIVHQCQVKSLPIANNNGNYIAPYLAPEVSPANCPQERNRLNLAAIEDATYPLTRYLSVIVKQDGGRAQQAGEAYTKIMLTQEIQQLIGEVGFVPIN